MLLLLFRGGGPARHPPARRGVRVIAGPIRRSAHVPARPADDPNTAAYIDPPPAAEPAGPPYTPNTQP